jgi:hypothetical protein
MSSKEYDLGLQVMESESSPAVPLEQCQGTYKQRYACWPLLDMKVSSDGSL